MARTTISIPDALKVEMDQIDHINWSFVAQNAFRRVINFEKEKAALTGDDEMMTQAVQRLSTDKQQFQEKRAAKVDQLALNAGAEWARERASYEQLASLEQNLEAAGCVSGLGTMLVGYGITDDNEMYLAIDEANEPPHEFWNWTIGLPDELFPLAMDENTRETFAGAFFQGALEVWEAVKERV